jgi:hypothetical protein
MGLWGLYAIAKGRYQPLAVGCLGFALIGVHTLSVVGAVRPSSGRIAVLDDQPSAVMALDGASRPLSSVQEGQSSAWQIAPDDAVMSDHETTGVEALRGSVSAIRSDAAAGQAANDAAKPSPAQQPEANSQVLSPTEGGTNPLQKLIKPPPEPIGTMVVIPLIVNGNSRAFSDSAIVLAESFADRLEVSVPGAKIIHPTELWENIQAQHVAYQYERLVDQMHQSGRPSASQTKFLLGQLYPGVEVQRVFWIEAQIDMERQDDPANLWERAKQWACDDIPKGGNYFLSGRVQAYDLADPSMPKLWAFSRTESIKAARLGPVSTSVYDRPGTQMAVAQTARWMSRQMQLVMPAKVAWKVQPDVLTRVQGSLATGSATPRIKLSN